MYACFPRERYEIKKHKRRLLQDLESCSPNKNRELWPRESLQAGGACFSVQNLVRVLLCRGLDTRGFEHSTRGYAIHYIVHQEHYNSPWENASLSAVEGQEQLQGAATDASSWKPTALQHRALQSLTDANLSQPFPKHTVPNRDCMARHGGTLGSIGKPLPKGSKYINQNYLGASIV